MRSQVQQIFKATPREKQVLMFSATINAATREVCKKFTQTVRMRFYFIYLLLLFLHEDKKRVDPQKPWEKIICLSDTCLDYS